MFFTYTTTSPNGDRYNGSLAAFLTSYLGYPTPTSLLNTSVVSICPAQKLKLPVKTLNPPLYVPVSYFSQAKITNDPPTGADVTTFTFGRPDSAPDRAPTKKHLSIKRPSDVWVMTDCDTQFLNSLGYTASSGVTYYDYVPTLPVHSGKSPARRNYLFYDWSVRNVSTPQ